MKYLFFALLVSGCLVAESAFGQRKDFLSFREMFFDFGTVHEEMGAVTHTFEFENTSERSVKILSVKPSCGCTTPDWSKEAIKPGTKGFITAKFDPTDRPGFFSKTLAITTDYNNESLVLTIKGTVSLKSDLSTYRETKGNWRLLSTSFNMGKVLLKDEITWKDFEVVNGGEAAITVTTTPLTPAYIKVQITPAMLQPGEKGVIRIGYNGKLKNAYGFQSDNVEFLTDDEAMPRKSFSVYATLEDFFPALTKEELAKAPRLVLGESLVDLGRFSSSTTIERKVAITNTGKKELSLNAIQANCECLEATAEVITLAPGKSTQLTVRFNPAQRKGTQQKFVTLYSNDPVNPVQRISLTAYIEY